MLEAWRRCSSIFPRGHAAYIAVSKPSRQWHSTKSTPWEERKGKSAGPRLNERHGAEDPATRSTVGSSTGRKTSHRSLSATAAKPESQRIAPRDAATIATRLLNSIPNVSLDRSNAPLRAITILKQHADLDFEALLSSFEPLSVAKTSQNPLLVFFATRSFAAELSSRPDLVARAADRLVSPDASACKTLETIIAIVDTLPRPAPLSTTRLRIVPDITDDIGSEGVCVALSSSEHLGTSSGRKDNWSPDSSRFTHSLEPDKPGTVTCCLNPLHVDILERLFKLPNISERVVYDTFAVQLPLPSTIFENGQHHTLLHSRFARNPETNAWSYRGMESVQHAQVVLPFGPGPDYSNTLDLPLVRLTDPFLVRHCMGNIVREVQLVDKEQGKVTPASEGLETAVANYFVDQGVQPHALSVWALIVPQLLLQSGKRLNAIVAKLTSRGRVARPDSQQWPKGLGTANSALLQALLRKGAKLRRVTSGGGGWGNKAGLLSLDPETSFQVKDPINDPVDHDHDSAWRHTGLEPIAEPGDLIQFYLLPPHLLETDHFNSSLMEYQAKDDYPTCEFGVIPSTIDRIEQKVDLDVNQQTEPIILKNRFGVLSERGMSIQVRKYVARNDSLWSHYHETKIDVPLARLSIRRSGKVRPWSQPSESREQADKDSVLKEAVSNGMDRRASEAVAGLGFKPTIPRRKEANFSATDTPHHEKGDAVPLLIRYTNKSVSSPRDSALKSYNRKPPRDFREGYASSQEKAFRLSRHPKVVKPVRFVDTAGYKNLLPITTLPAGSRHSEAAMTEDEYFWRPTPVSEKVRAADEATRAALEARRVEGKRRVRRLEAIDWHRKNSLGFEELSEEAASVSTGRDVEQPRPPERAAHGPSKLSQMTAAMLMDGKRQR